ncbi:MAG: RCC1 domain-containing protein [Caldilineales bacterium]|nr:RCC1 domain-containing protein [Caldilineales bacterium]
MAAARVAYPDLFALVGTIAADNSHTCALTTDGGVKCWGWDAYGQLGLGTSTY